MRPARSARVRAARFAILLLLAPGAAPAHAAGAAAASAPAAAAHPYAAHVTEASQRFGIPELWIWRVMHAESRGRARAVSSAGAMGLMQIMPATWAMLTARHRLGADPFDVRGNILAGAAYLRAMWDRYGDVRLMLAAYNAGPGRADAYAAGRRGLPAETIAYVAAIAPEIGGGRVQSAAVDAPSAPSSWRSASLFAAQASATDADGSAAPALQTQRSAPAPSTLPVGASAVLFVRLSGSAE
ncbi:MAG: lytic transglycosylase domain-containing protein [Sphingopyxis sp.]|jgi:soluble lytic murein transglycosylase-like protein|uniref:lytic transglycosylase domain-containing protein n=1 Tax=Sphingopyxis sp. TaxID=1908224 RepID=UPI002ABAEB9D|nr:lytic transglycosylase domain-containing protein [Sphingopyxis sp.]MDZ3831912.1 lytic transglycosylase domain-containing protein [Sphingopyxis sp.]